MLRIIKDRNRKYSSIGISVNPAFWDFDKNKPRRNCPNRLQIERLIAGKSKPPNGQRWSNCRSREKGLPQRRYMKELQIRLLNARSARRSNLKSRIWNKRGEAIQTRTERYGHKKTRKRHDFRAQKWVLTTKAASGEPHDAEFCLPIVQGSSIRTFRRMYRTNRHLRYNGSWNSKFW